MQVYPPKMQEWISKRQPAGKAGVGESEPTEIAGVGDDKESVDDDNIESEQDEV